MHRFEYRVVPAPRRGEKVKGAKTASDRFAVTLTHLMNDLGRDGWEYLRADTLPCEERVGFTGKTTTFQNMLVFRRTLPDAAPVFNHAAPRATLPVVDQPAVKPPVVEQEEAVPAFFRREEETPQPAALAATLTARPGDADTPRVPPVNPPQGAAPALGPARGGLAAE